MSFSTVFLFAQPAFMIKKFTAGVLFFLLTSGLPLYGQIGFTNKEEAKNQYVEGKKHGWWIEYLDSNSLLVGKDTAVYYGLVVYDKGQKTEIARYYTIKGDRLQTETSYLNNKRNGVNKIYFPDTLALKAEINYKDDFIEGEGINYYRNGKPKLRGYYKKGKLHGVERSYYHDGGLRNEIPYINGIREGMAIEYFENGKPSGKTPYMLDKIEGEALKYFESGALQAVFTYVSSQKHGLTKNYFETGNLQIEIPFCGRKGRRHF